MSDQNIPPADGEDDPWARAESASDAGLGAQAVFDEASSASSDTDVVDATATELPARRPSLVPKIVIGSVVVVVLGVAASGMYNLYRKIRPAPQEVATVDDRAVASSPPSEAAAPLSQAMPSRAQMAGEAVTIGAAAPGAASSAPGGAAPMADAAASAAATAFPVATGSTPAALQVDPAATAPAATAGVEPSKAQLPQATKAVDKPKAVASKPAAAAAAAAQCADAGEQPVLRSVTATVAKHKTLGHRTKRLHPARAMVAKAGESKKAHAKAAVAASKSDADPPVEKVDGSFLVGYRIVSIEPTFGEHQNAWIRRPDGRLRVVAKGDRLDGSQVLKIDGSAYEVVTTQGVIR